MIIKNCPACRDYNIFGIDSECCCYDKHEYCRNIDDCVMKQIVKQCTEGPNERVCNERVVWFLRDGYNQLKKKVLECLEIEDEESQII